MGEKLRPGPLRTLTPAGTFTQLMFGVAVGSP